MATTLDSSFSSEVPTNKRAKAKLDKVIWHNILCSSIALVSAFCGLLGEAVLSWIANDTSDPDVQNTFRMWALVSVGIDNFIGTLAIHSMTSGWLPKRLRLGKTVTSATTEENTTNREGKVVNAVGTTADEEEKGSRQPQERS